MRKIVIIVFATLALTTMQAQEVGIRFGGTSGVGGVALDAVFGTGASRIHANLGFYGDRGIGVDVLWDLIYKPLGGEAFYWYLGVGPSALLGDPFYLGVSGEIGLEYRFNTVPIVIGADWRPTLWVVEKTDFSPQGFGLNVRWNFGN